MFRSMFRVTFALVVALSLALGLFAGAGTHTVFAASDPDGTGYCYPSGYNRQGWRCGWRLAQAPYNLGDYNRYYYGNGYYYYNNYNYGYGYPYYNGGTGGQPENISDYGGRPRFGWYYYGYYNNGYNNYCDPYSNPYCTYYYP